MDPRIPDTGVRVRINIAQHNFTGLVGVPLHKKIHEHCLFLTTKCAKKVMKNAQNKINAQVILHNKGLEIAHTLQILVSMPISSIYGILKYRLASTQRNIYLYNTVQYSQ